MKCPLCENTKISRLETVNKNDLVYLYRKMTGVDFTYLINQNFDYCECRECKLRYFDPLISGDEEFYNSLQKFDWYYMDEKEEYSYAKKYIKATDKVLEVGSGKGAFAKHIDVNDYIGLDFSENAKKLAAKNHIEIENETIEDYSGKHVNSFDAVVSFQVLEHVSDPKEFIEAKIEVLKTGGIMIIAVPSEDSFLKYVTNGVLNMPPHHVTRWSDKTLKYISERYNLELNTIYHERVQKIHKRWFMKTLIESTVTSNRLIDVSLKNQFISKGCNLLSKIFTKKFKDEMLPNGHTALAVYTKK